MKEAIVIHGHLLVGNREGYDILDLDDYKVLDSQPNKGMAIKAARIMNERKQVSDKMESIDKQETELARLTAETAQDKAS